jgi:hypothetical protein
MNRDPMNSAFDMYRMMAAAAEACTRYAWTGPLQGGAAPTDTAQQMSRLYMAFVNSGYRYLARWAEISAKRYPEFAALSSGMSATRAVTDAEMAALVDSLRAYLREMSDLPVEEAKRLQAEIDAIMGQNAASREKAAAAGPTDTQKRGRRRARAKR